MDALHALREALGQHPGLPQAVHARPAVASLRLAGLLPSAPACACLLHCRSPCMVGICHVGATIWDRCTAVRD